MSLNSGLFRTQDQTEQDLLQGPGWTIDDQKPSFFDNAIGAIPRGIGQGVADGISVLTDGLQSQVLPAMLKANPFANLLTGGGDVNRVPAWKQSSEALADTAQVAREYSKSLMPDPRVTGTGANILQGFSKAATEFTAGSLAGGPGAGAALLGASEGYGHYRDLLDQGVDEDTARRSALLTAATSAGSALMPMALAARLFESLPTAGTLMAQAGAGALINTGFGAAQRYASAKILTDAGYQTLADQQRPLDEENLLTDAVTGLFFGAHAGWHGLKDLKASDVDPAIRDAVKVVQDRQQVAERAPGVPVDMRSAAVHRQMLETALGDLMADKSVDLSQVDADGVSFARPDQDSADVRAIMREEFENSGVLDEAAAFDRWLAGEEETEARQRETKQANAETTETRVAPFEISEADAKDGLLLHNLPRELATQWAAAHPGYVGPDGENGLDDRYAKVRAALQTGDALDAPSAHVRQSPKGPELEFYDGRHRFAAARDLGYDTIPVALTPESRGVLQELGIRPAGAAGDIATPILTDRPALVIADETGKPTPAAAALESAKQEEAQANAEADPMHQAAVACEARHA